MGQPILTFSQFLLHATPFMQGVNFSIELSWLLKEVYAYWCVYLMDTFIKILPEKIVILFTSFKKSAQFYTKVISLILPTFRQY